MIFIHKIVLYVTPHNKQVIINCACELQMATSVFFTILWIYCKILRNPELKAYLRPHVKTTSRARRSILSQLKVPVISKKLNSITIH